MTIILLLLILLLDYENRECQKYFWNGSIVQKKAVSSEATKLLSGSYN